MERRERDEGKEGAALCKHLLNRLSHDSICNIYLQKLEVNLAQLPISRIRQISKMLF